MGNRAVVTFNNRSAIEKYIKDASRPMHLEGYVKDHTDTIGVYLHWNGGYDSVKSFCMACKELGYRSPVSDDYGIACFVQLVRNFFGIDGLSVGVDVLSRLDCDNGDNGVFVVDDEWEIVGREYEQSEQTRNDDYYEKFKDYIVGMSKAMEEAHKKFDSDSRF
jgi:hypothetical protein